MRLFVTGLPGVGKTTLVLKVAEEMQGIGLKIGGFTTQEVRKKGRRVGFKIKAIDTKEEGILAWVGEGYPRVGKYVVNLEDLNRVGVSAIRRAISEADLIIIDEIGAMEYKSREFAKIINEVLKKEKPLLATVHRRYTERFRGMGKLYVLTTENREKIKDEVIKELKALFSFKD
ncbi:NTPase [Thermococcus sp. MV5]|uniref:NTPase n=1 Tax=Thermococcus sp. MV5 TaxID=1638272 RepID=UPI001438AC5D|nr:NTPase [Thermococcus sp. MV5]NJE26955.1 NTPase [Thermococcus sp. MV5]